MNTGTSQHICRDKRLFIAPLVKCSGVEIGGLGGSISAAGVGTIQLSIVDDQHRPHNIILHNVLYVPESPVNLISPQRWTQESVMKEGANKGTFFCNFGDESIFVSNKRQYMKTIFNDPVTNLNIHKKDLKFSDLELIFKDLKSLFEKKGYIINWKSLEKQDLNETINALAMASPFSLEEKQILLESQNLEIRKNKIAEILTTYSYDNFSNTTIQ